MEGALPSWCCLSLQGVCLCSSCAGVWVGVVVQVWKAARRERPAAAGGPPPAALLLPSAPLGAAHSSPGAELRAGVSWTRLSPSRWCFAASGSGLAPPWSPHLVHSHLSNLSCHFPGEAFFDFPVEARFHTLLPVCGPLGSTAVVIPVCVLLRLTSTRTQGRSSPGQGPFPLPVSCS